MGKGLKKVKALPKNPDRAVFILKKVLADITTISKPISESSKILTNTA